MVGIVSAAGLVGFLSEPDTELQVFALKTADKEISLLWTELAGAVGQIEALYENELFPERELAALVAAKIYYNLQEYDESMVFALGAGKLFDINRKGEFEDTIIARCIDTYIAISAAQNIPSTTDPSEQPLAQLSAALSATTNGSASTFASMTSPTTPFSQSTLPSKSLLAGEAGLSGAPTAMPAVHKGTLKSLQSVIRRIFERCFREGAFRQVVGIAIEAKNLDILRETIKRAGEGDESTKGSKTQDKSGRREELMDYLLDICMNIIQERSLRTEILQLILDLLVSSDIASPDYLSIARCIVYLGQHSMAAHMVRQLVEQDNARSLIMSYQIAFDLYDNSTQEFLTKVVEELPRTEEQGGEFSMANGHTTQPIQPDRSENAQESDQLLSELEDRAGTPATATVVSRTRSSPLTPEHINAYTSIRDILQGTKSIQLGLEFLYRTNKADHNVLNKLKNSLEGRNSIFHSAVTFANAFMNSGTTSDWFIRDNLDWLGKAVNWSKFSVTAALGVIHQGNIGQGRKLLEPYLKDSIPAGSGSKYSKGGALFALGLIYTNHGKYVLDYLLSQLEKADSEEIVQHGAALGLGVAGMATGSEDIVDKLKSALFSDSAISGQAAGLAMGLVMLGSGNINALENMITYAHETEHDKTVRGLALGMALIMYARQEAADELINGLLEDPDPTIRYGGIMTIALAYCGTSSNKAVRKLLHVAVSDVNDDVRRVAVMSLGFVLFKKPGSVPRMVELLAESYNPHVRYGATMALGIACAGTGLEEAVDLLEPMMKDSTDFVRQGTFIALAMILVQQSEAMNSKVVSFRKHLTKVISDRHEDAMAKFGAALALGIIDAGGRNCTIGLQTQSANLNMAGIVGMAVFTQYWYWFPLTHFLSLSFTPTSVIGVDQDLEVPKFKFHCATRPSMFEYPPSMEVKAEEAPEKVKTAVLSTTAQAKRRKMAKEKQQGRDSMDVDQTPTTPKIATVEEDKMDTDEDAAKNDEGKNNEDSKPDDSKAKGEEETPQAKTAKARLEKEKVGYELENMSRVLPPQLKYISFPEGRYIPVKKPTGGIVLLTDTRPTEPKELIERQIKSSARAAPGANDGQTAATEREEPEVDAGNAAGVLTAVDEDEDGGDEAELPGEFDYYSDHEGE